MSIEVTWLPVTYLVGMPDRHKIARNIRVESMKPWVPPSNLISYCKAEDMIDIDEPPDYHQHIEEVKTTPAEVPTSKRRDGLTSTALRPMEPYQTARLQMPLSI